MLISLEHRLLFVCVPKCASTSIESALLPYADMNLRGTPGLRHLGIRDFDTHIRPLLEQFGGAPALESFCVLRDPLDWAHSWFRYRGRRSLARPDHPNHDNYTGDMSFDAFVEALLEPDPPDYARIGTQAWLLERPDGTLAVDHLFDYARLKRLKAFLRDRIGHQR